MATVSSSAQTARLLELMAHLDPRWWEIINPPQPSVVNGGLSTVRSTADVDEVALNPQPLPPSEALWRAIRDMSVSVAEATIAASLAGRKPAEILKEVGDDICPRPPKIPWPKKWPVPVQLQHALAVDGNLVAPAIQATAAIVFQTYATRTTDKALSTAFAGLADRLADTALSNAAAKV